MEKGKKASKYIREAREITNNSCSKLIKGQGALNHFFLAMQERPDTKSSDKEEKEIESEIEKMQGMVEYLVETTQNFERLWLKGQQRRTNKGRRDHLHNDSGFISVDSSVLPLNSEPPSIIAQPTVDPNEKQPSEGYEISLSGPAALPSVTVVTEETLTDDHKSDTSFSEIAPTEAGASAASIIQDVKYFTKHPLEHEEPNSVLDHDKETCTDTNDKLNLDKCDKLDPDSIELSREKEAKKNEKTNNTESDLCEIPSDEPAQAQADVRTRATDTEQEPKEEAVRGSAAFTNNLGEDSVFLQAQGNHQKLRHKCSKNKSNSL